MKNTGGTFIVYVRVWNPREKKKKKKKKDTNHIWVFLKILFVCVLFFGGLFSFFFLFISLGTSLDFEKN
jgi:flagellar basal body-associated protein FliL